MIKIYLFLSILVTIVFANDSVIIGKLQWQDNIEVGKIQRDWIGAISYCNKLYLEGKNDWRLPTIKELQSIIDFTRDKPAIQSSFKNTKGDYYYWSFNAQVSGFKDIWSVDFEDGCTASSSNHSSVKHSVRCVRDR